MATRDFSPKVNFRRRLSCCVFTASVCNSIHQHLCMCSKSQTPAAAPLFGHMKMLHTVRNEWRCSCGHCCLTRVRQPEFFTRDNEVQSKQQQKNSKISLAQSYLWRELPQVSFLLRQTCVCHDKTCLSLRKKYFVATKTFSIQFKFN